MKQIDRSVERCQAAQPLAAEVLRAYLDGELPADEQERVAMHLDGCAACSANLVRLQATAALVGRRLAALEAASAPGVAPEVTAALVATLVRARRPVPGALERLRPRWAALAENWVGPAAWSRPAAGVAMASMALVVAVAAALTQPAVRSAADSVMQQFRVQRLQPVQIDTLALAAQMEQWSKQALPQLSDLGTFTMSAEPRLRSAAGKEEASRLAGMPVRLPARTPAGLPSQPALLVSDRLQFTFEYNGPKAAAAAQAVGMSDPALLANLTSLDGLVVRGDVPATVAAVYGDVPALHEEMQVKGQGGRPAGPAGSSAARAPEAVRGGPTGRAGVQGPQPAAGDLPRLLVVVQLRSPAIELPADPRINVVREQVLRAAPLPPALTAQLLSISDWPTTVPVPVTTGAAREVSVDGVTGWLVTGEAPGPRLIWQKDGIIYAVFATGADAGAEALEAARSLR